MALTSQILNQSFDTWIEFSGSLLILRSRTQCWHRIGIGRSAGPRVSSESTPTSAGWIAGSGHQVIRGEVRSSTKYCVRVETGELVSATHPAPSGQTKLPFCTILSDHSTSPWSDANENIKPDWSAWNSNCWKCQWKKAPRFPAIQSPKRHYKLLFTPHTSLHRERPTKAMNAYKFCKRIQPFVCTH